jgi:hypothetical protein
MLSNDQRKLLTTAVAVVAGCALAWYLMVDRNPPRQQVQVARQLKHPPTFQPKPRPGSAILDAQQEPVPLPPPVFSLKPRPRSATTQPLNSNPSDTTETLPDEIDPQTLLEPTIPVEVARAALGFVGADPQAEEVWYAAINDPSLSPKARQDLIEDLNEEGFADPKNITEEDLPLIYSRLALLEQIAPDAMDDVNAAAFAEADKDLWQMVFRLERETIAREEALQEAQQAAQAPGEDITTAPLRRPLRR